MVQAISHSLPSLAPIAAAKRQATEAKRQATRVEPLRRAGQRSLKSEASGGLVWLRPIGVLFGGFGKKWMAIPGLPGGLIIYQGYPSISPKRTPMVRPFVNTPLQINVEQRTTSLLEEPCFFLGGASR